MQFTLNINSTCNAKSETWFLFFCVIVRGWFHSLGEEQHFSVFNYNLINNQCFPSDKNQSIDLYCKSVDWFLYDREHRSLICQWILGGCSHGGKLARLGGLARLSEMSFIPRSYEIFYLSSIKECVMLLEKDCLIKEFLQ